MADNIQVRDASGALLTMRTQEVAGVHTPYQIVSTPNGAAVAGSLSALSQAVTATDLGGFDGVLVATAGTFAGTVAFEASQDGTNWYVVQLSRSSTGTQESTRALTGTTLEGWKGNLAGWSQFRVRCSLYTSGTATISITPIAAVIEPVNAVAATQSGTWTIRNNIFYNDSTTAQAASATLTGTSRDTSVAASAVQPYASFKAFAFSDQAGTVRIEASNDNTTWRRVTVDTAVAANTPVFLSVPVLTRYHRVVYVNGATLQTLFMLNSGYTIT